MKNNCLIFLLSLITTLAFAEDFTVSKMLQSNPVSVFDLTVNLESQSLAVDEKGALVIFKKDPTTGKYIMNANQATITLSGKYSTTYCFISELSGRAIPENRNLRWPNVEGTLEFIGTSRYEKNQKLAELSSLACAGGSMGSFTFPFTTTLNAGLNPGESVSWKYEIKTGENPNEQSTQSLEIQLSPVTGWKVELK